MTELLVLLVVAAAYALGRARDERDRLLALLHERRSGPRLDRQHWQPVEAQLEAERQVWRQTVAVQQAAREAMQDVMASVASEARGGETRRPAAGTGGARTSKHRQRPDQPAMSSSGMADGLRRAVMEKAR